MKIRVLFTVVLIMSMLPLSQAVNAQIVKPKEVIKEQGTNRINNRIDQGVDAGFNKIEEGVGSLFKKKKGSGGEEEEAEEIAPKPKQRLKNTKTKRGRPKYSKTKNGKLYQYDFIRGTKFFTSRTSARMHRRFPGAVDLQRQRRGQNVNIAPGKWLHMNGEDAVYCYSKTVAFPGNFIVEFDIIPDEENRHGIVFTLYEENPEDPKEINDDLYPGKSGFHITLSSEGWETKGYTNDPEGEWIEGQASKNPVNPKSQSRHHLDTEARARIYHQGARCLTYRQTFMLIQNSQDSFQAGTGLPGQ
jgi:hypothetical protein